MLLSARRVGPAGKAYGLDMTEEMLALARRNAADAGATNVEFLKGHIEQIPLPAETIDVVISNCVVNLSPDKAAVLSEAFRVLRPGGRLGITDVVAEDRLTEAERAERGDWAGCIAGALARTSTPASWPARASMTSASPSRTTSPTACTARSCRRSSPGAATVLAEPGAGAAPSPAAADRPCPCRTG